MDLYYFNPGCEIEVAANIAVYSLPKYPALLEHDLSVLPMCFAQRGDCVLISQTKDVDFLTFWKDIYGCNFWENCDKKLNDSIFDSFKPWGISPRVLKMAEKYIFSHDYLLSVVGRWRNEHRLLFSRATSAKFFEDLTANDDYDELLLTPQKNLPRIAATWEDAFTFFNSQNGGSVFKAIYGSSGRGVRILKNNVMTPNLENWIRSVINAQEAISCEHFFDKYIDFSMHYDIKGGKANFVGISTFSTSDTGAYIGSRVGRLSSIPYFNEEVTNKLASLHIKTLEKSTYCHNYIGPLGIDCMVYRCDDSLKINPCIEINCRYSMGRLAMQLADIVATDAIFYVFPNNAKPFDTISKPIFSNGKLIGGFLPLTPNDTQKFTAGIYCLQSPPNDDCRI